MVKHNPVKMIIIFSLMIFMLDQLSKFYVVHILDLPTRLSMTVIPGLFTLK